ncbi:hypothetical protein CI102_4195 [Trichoderma harzianum]|uniref:Major facilitator superfamily (MFS) profile domain-containing protein n=1 Tax=Trichoderma harzianum CBS 226.95 TaxID=983964 RepID=A0A2T3ZU06_TRIHA|nr:hypothetical protein M431DRAFT_501365 [Trichoderma harzianum CBS 226.95]PKK50855.1 hypothetical protein CI102_4195 [Trichoderma harzianum]PTB48285.1 hypothetical protein M431DRAFT_501365 [Trichoderma harzianum CBS 226.95]
MKDTNVPGNSDCEHDKLSLLRGWTAAFEIIMSFMTAAPYGMAADIYGRKRILQLSIAGIILAQAFDAVICGFPETFPIHLMGLKGVWALIGGGSTVLSAMIFTIASDISLDTQNWISIYAGFGCLVASFWIALSLPETLVPELRSGGPMMASETRIPSSHNFRLTHRFLIEKLRFSPLRKDIFISRASIIALVTGSLVIAIAKQAQSTIVIAAIYVYALGCGYNPAMYSLLGLLSGGHHIGILYATIGAMQSIGTFIAGLMFGVSVQIVPFIFTFLFLAVVVGSLFCLKLEEREEGEPIWIDMDYLESHSNW